MTSQWNSFTNYRVGDQVQNGSSVIYGCILINTNQPPPNPTYWNTLAPVATGVASLQALTEADNGGNLVLASPDATFTTTPSTGTINMAISFPSVPVYQATYYKSVQQNLVNANTDITFDVVATWSNPNGYITHTSGTTNFTVVVAGLYQLEFNLSINANGATWNNAVNKAVSIDITRTTLGEQAVIQNNALTAVNTSYQQAVSSSYYLNVGDIINLRSTLAFASATPFAVGILNTFDLNTFFTWQYITSGSPPPPP